MWESPYVNGKWKMENEKWKMKNGAPASCWQRAGWEAGAPFSFIRGAPWRMVFPL
jgi:hypothetical protein